MKIINKVMLRWFVYVRRREPVRRTDGMELVVNITGEEDQKGLVGDM